MKASELRLGNIIKLGGNTLNTYQTYKPVKVCLAFLNEIFAENEERPDAELSVYQPVGLTDEWLLRLGFEMDNSGVEKDHQDYCEWYQRKFPIIGELITNSDMSFVFDIETDTLRIRYVHQLQNLYFALTGCELPIASADHVPDVGNKDMNMVAAGLTEEELELIKQREVDLVELAKMFENIEDQGLKNVAQAADVRDVLEVWSDLECIFKYCPTPDLCKAAGCLCKKKRNL